MIPSVNSAPLVILAEKILYPNVYIDFDNITDSTFISSLQLSQEKYNGYFIMTYKKNPIEAINSSNIGSIGLLCQIQDFKEINNNLKLIYEVNFRYDIQDIISIESSEQLLIASGIVIDETYVATDKDFQTSLVSAYKNFITYLKNYSPMDLAELKSNHLASINDIDPKLLVSLFFTYCDLTREEKIKLLNSLNTKENLDYMNLILKNWIDKYNQTVKINQLISKKTSENMEKSQKEYILREQLKTIKKELHEMNESSTELEELHVKFKNSILPVDVERKIQRDFDRLTNMSNNSAEYHSIENYIHTILNFPWNNESNSEIDLLLAETILNEEHFGLDKIKTIIIEFLAVKKLNPDYKSQIMCLFGPPGIGKTSICKSIAKALNREYVRISLGGVSDEAEIRGHRKTYVGAMAGKIAQALITAKTNNPVIVLDEIDKIGHHSHKGSVEASLLEVLDPEQNHSFQDHFLGVKIDLSKVLFIATANDLSNVSLPLLDRMEIIEMESYTLNEKKEIAKQYIIPQEIKKIGLSIEQILIDDAAISILIETYTRESGVRTLRKKINELMRKCAVQYIKNKENIKINIHNLSLFMGEQEFSKDQMKKIVKPGIATGLAWTPVGGDILFIESLFIKGHGNLHLTGKLGDVMKESAHIALSVVKSQNSKFSTQLKANDLHIHFPAGSIPKDGPSAGITIAAAIYSLLVNKNINKKLAMTGELSLSGLVMPVGGIKEKLIAAYAAGAEIIIIPEENVSDLKKLPKELIKNKKFKIYPVKSFEDVIKLIF